MNSFFVPLTSEFQSSMAFICTCTNGSAKRRHRSLEWTILRLCSVQLVSGKVTTKHSC